MSAGCTLRLSRGFWEPQPQHSLKDAKIFKAGLYIGERLAVEGDIAVHLALAEAGKEISERASESRKRSQTETKSIFWVAALDEAIDRTMCRGFPFEGNAVAQGAGGTNQGRICAHC